MPGMQRGRGARILAGAALLLLLGLLLWIAAGPLTTNDLWWHLRHGQAFVSEGFWPARDPCLHTAERPPTPHEWLFAVTVYGVDAGLGLHGLRVAHGLAVVGILLLALSVFRRAGAGAAAALLATAVFVVLSWYRLVQLRPELISIAAVLALHRLLFEPEAPPSRARVAGAALLVGVWANAHTLFMIGPLLMLAALFGLAAQAGLARWWVREPVSDDVAQRARRIAAALVLALLVALINPRGVAQHLAFVTASQHGAIYAVLDEWARFDPLAWTNYPVAVSAVAWALTDALLLAFVAVAAWVGIRFLRAPSREGLRELDLVGLALGAAGLVALLASIRFLWLSVLPLAWLLRQGRGVFAAPAAGWLAAAASAGLAIAFPLWGGWSTAAALLPRDPSRWLAEPYTGERFHEEGIRFLEETGVEGNLFNTYEMGGFLCYRLAPRMRTFLDGSMNFPDAVLREQHRVSVLRGVWPFESYLDVLERRGIDVFFGVGVPAPETGGPGEGTYTTTNLEHAPGWLLVSRGMRHGIYLRDDERNRENLRRIAAWYREQGVPFDPVRGLDPDAVVAARPDWAVAHQLVPPRWLELLAAREAGRAAADPRPFEAVGLVLALNGAYGAQLENDRVGASLAPEAKAPRRRIVWALLHLDRPDDALRAALGLLAIDRDDPRSGLFARSAAIFQRLSGQPFPEPSVPDPVPPQAFVIQLPLLTSRSPLRQ